MRLPVACLLCLCHTAAASESMPALDRWSFAAGTFDNTFHIKGRVDGALDHDGSLIDFGERFGFDRKRVTQLYEFQYLFADRTSTSVMRANQLRLYFSSIAYVTMNALRRFGLAGTEMERAQCHTIREKLFKIGALVRVSVRRVLVLMASGYPYERIFQQVYWNLRALHPLRC